MAPQLPAQMIQPRGLLEIQILQDQLDRHQLLNQMIQHQGQPGIQILPDLPEIQIPQDLLGIRTLRDQRERHQLLNQTNQQHLGPTHPRRQIQRLLDQQEPLQLVNLVTLQLRRQLLPQLLQAPNQMIQLNPRVLDHPRPGHLLRPPQQVRFLLILAIYLAVLMPVSSTKTVCLSVLVQKGLRLPTLKPVKKMMDLTTTAAL